MAHARAAVVPVLLGCLLAPPTAWTQDQRGARRQPPPSAARIGDALELIGLDATAEELELMRRGVRENRRHYERNRRRPLGPGDAPAVRFRPLGDPARLHATAAVDFELPAVTRPDDLGALAFAPLPELAALIHSRQVRCIELVELFLERLQRHDPTLHCVISLLPDRARARARALDTMLDEGRWLGPLHGIPFGAKDLLAARGAPTTWGAAPYRDQRFDEDAALVRTLEDRGAVLIAKLSLGALAWGDVWFGGTTRNPWDPRQGSSGSSAGSAAAVAAGLVPFALGSETLGSIVSPSVRCGTTGLRPTFGLLSTEGAMPLSWTMDKLGPLCRSATDAGLVLDALLGGLDPAGDGRTRARLVRGGDARPGRVGVLQGTYPPGHPFRTELQELGCELVDFALPESASWARDLTFVLDCEAATAFDELTRSGADDELVRQIARAWPNVFRTARLVPAVEYLRAMRLRRVLMEDLQRAFAEADLDVVVHPPYAGPVLAATNLTGHPCVVAPRGMREDGRPGAVCFTGRTWGEVPLLALVQAWQRQFPHHRAARPAVH